MISDCYIEFLNTEHWCQNQYTSHQADRPTRQIQKPLRRNFINQRASPRPNRTQTPRTRSQRSLQPNQPLPTPLIRCRLWTISICANICHLQRRKYSLLRQQPQTRIQTNLLLGRCRKYPNHPTRRLRHRLSGEMPPLQNDLQIHRPAPIRQSANGAASLPILRRRSDH